MNDRKEREEKKEGNAEKKEGMKERNIKRKGKKDGRWKEGMCNEESYN